MGGSALKDNNYGHETKAQAEAQTESNKAAEGREISGQQAKGYETTSSGCGLLLGAGWPKKRGYKIMEYLNEILWWALATGFIKFGSGGNKSPKPPKPNLKQSQKLTKADYRLKEKFTPRLTAAAGRADRREYDRNLDFALQRLGDQRIIGRVNRAMPEVRAQRTALNRLLQSAGRSSAEYRRAQTAMQRGLQAQQATTAQGRAAGMGDVANVQAGQVGQGAIGQSLMNQALERANSTGQLSAEASRDATQAARSGMAARGMATGSAGLAAEMLNRDRFARQRQAEDLNFAQVVQSQDLLRQFNNVGNNMQAALANQQTQFGRQQIISGNQQQANMANMAALNQGSQFNAAQRDAVNRYNMGLLGTASQMSDFERSRQLGLGQDAYNFALSSNPNMVAMGLGSGYSNMTQPAMSLMGGQNMQMMYSGGKFSGQGGGFNMAGAGMGALSGAASGAMIGSVVPGIGTAVGAIGGGLLGGFGGGLSDKREKTDIKKIDGPTNVIGIPAYEYRYKGEKKKRRGVMAQDVQKVLPEAVAEVDYKGKKRLAIKPAVIGAALAEHLAADTKPVALAS